MNRLNGSTGSQKVRGRIFGPESEGDIDPFNLEDDITVDILQRERFKPQRLLYKTSKSSRQANYEERATEDESIVHSSQRLGRQKPETGLSRISFELTGEGTKRFKPERIDQNVYSSSRKTVNKPRKPVVSNPVLERNVSSYNPKAYFDDGSKSTSHLSQDVHVLTSNAQEASLRAKLRVQKRRRELEAKETEKKQQQTLDKLAKETKRRELKVQTISRAQVTLKSYTQAHKARLNGEKESKYRQLRLQRDLADRVRKDNLVFNHTDRENNQNSNVDFNKQNKEPAYYKASHTRSSATDVDVHQKKPAVPKLSSRSIKTRNGSKIKKMNASAGKLNSIANKCKPPVPRFSYTKTTSSVGKIDDIANAERIAKKASNRSNEETKKYMERKKKLKVKMLRKKELERKQQEKQIQDNLRQLDAKTRTLNQSRSSLGSRDKPTKRRNRSGISSVRSVSSSLSSGSLSSFSNTSTKQLLDEYMHKQNLEQKEKVKKVKRRPRRKNAGSEEISKPRPEKRIKRKKSKVLTDGLKKRSTSLPKSRKAKRALMSTTVSLKASGPVMRPVTELDAIATVMQKHLGKAATEEHIARNSKRPVRNRKQRKNDSTFSSSALDQEALENNINTSVLDSDSYECEYMESDDSIMHTIPREDNLEPQRKQRCQRGLSSTDTSIQSLEEDYSSQANHVYDVVQKAAHTVEKFMMQQAEASVEGRERKSDDSIPSEQTIRKHNQLAKNTLDVISCWKKYQGVDDSFTSEKVPGVSAISHSVLDNKHNGGGTHKSTETPISKMDLELDAERIAKDMLEKAVSNDPLLREQEYKAIEVEFENVENETIDIPGNKTNSKLLFPLKQRTLHSSLDNYTKRSRENDSVSVLTLIAKEQSQQHTHEVVDRVQDVEEASEVESDVLQVEHSLMSDAYAQQQNDTEHTPNTVSSANVNIDRAEALKSPGTVYSEDEDFETGVEVVDEIQEISHDSDSQSQSQASVSDHGRDCDIKQNWDKLLLNPVPSSDDVNSSQADEEDDVNVQEKEINEHTNKAGTSKKKRRHLSANDLRAQLLAQVNLLDNYNQTEKQLDTLQAQHELTLQQHETINLVNQYESARTHAHIRAEYASQAEAESMRFTETVNEIRKQSTEASELEKSRHEQEKKDLQKLIEKSKKRESGAQTDEVSNRETGTDAPVTNVHNVSTLTTRAQTNSVQTFTDILEKPQFEDRNPISKVRMPTVKRVDDIDMAKSIVSGMSLTTDGDEYDDEFDEDIKSIPTSLQDNSNNVGQNSGDISGIDVNVSGISVAENVDSPPDSPDELRRSRDADFLNLTRSDHDQSTVISVASSLSRTIESEHSSMSNEHDSPKSSINEDEKALNITRSVIVDDEDEDENSSAYSKSKSALSENYSDDGFENTTDNGNGSPDKDISSQNIARSKRPSKHFSNLSPGSGSVYDFRSVIPDEGFLRNQFIDEELSFIDDADLTRAGSHISTSILGENKDAGSAHEKKNFKSFRDFTSSLLKEYSQDVAKKQKHDHDILIMREKALKEKTREQLKWLVRKTERILQNLTKENGSPKNSNVLSPKSCDTKMPSRQQIRNRVERALESERRRTILQFKAGKASIETEKAALRERGFIERLRIQKQARLINKTFNEALDFKHDKANMVVHKNDNESALTGGDIARSSLEKSRDFDFLNSFPGRPSIHREGSDELGIKADVVDTSHYTTDEDHRFESSILESLELSRHNSPSGNKHVKVPEGNVDKVPDDDRTSMSVSVKSGMSNVSGAIDSTDESITESIEQPLLHDEGAEIPIEEGMHDDNQHKRNHSQTAIGELVDSVQSNAQSPVSKADSDEEIYTSISAHDVSDSLKESLSRQNIESFHVSNALTETGGDTKSKLGDSATDESSQNIDVSSFMSNSAGGLTGDNEQSKVIKNISGKSDFESGGENNSEHSVGQSSKSISENISDGSGQQFKSVSYASYGENSFIDEEESGVKPHSVSLQSETFPSYADASFEEYQPNREESLEDKSNKNKSESLIRGEVLQKEEASLNKSLLSSNDTNNILQLSVNEHSIEIQNLEKQLSEKKDTLLKLKQKERLVEKKNEQRLIREQLESDISRIDKEINKTKDSLELLTRTNHSLNLLNESESEKDDSVSGYEEENELSQSDRVELPVQIDEHDKRSSVGTDSFASEVHSDCESEIGAVAKDIALDSFASSDEAEAMSIGIDKGGEMYHKNDDVLDCSATKVGENTGTGLYDKEIKPGHLEPVSYSESRLPQVDQLLPQEKNFAKSEVEQLNPGNNGQVSLELAHDAGIETRAKDARDKKLKLTDSIVSLLLPELIEQCFEDKPNPGKDNEAIVEAAPDNTKTDSASSGYEKNGELKVTACSSASTKNENIIQKLPEEEADSQETTAVMSSYMDEETTDWTEVTRSYVTELFSFLERNGGLNRFKKGGDSKVNKNYIKEPISVDTYIAIEQGRNRPEFLQIYNKKIFDATNMALLYNFPAEFYDCEEQNVPWMRQSLRDFVKQNRPASSLSEMKEVILKSILRWDMIDQNSSDWAMSDQERMNKILCMEMNAKEKEWTNYQKDEVDIMFEVSDLILNDLILDTVRELQRLK